MVWIDTGWPSSSRTTTQRRRPVRSVGDAVVEGDAVCDGVAVVDADEEAVALDVEEAVGVLVLLPVCVPVVVPLIVCVTVEVRVRVPLTV